MNKINYESFKTKNSGLDRTLEEGLLFEIEFFGKVCDTEDNKEGTKACLEKRKAGFRGR